MITSDDIAIAIRWSWASALEAAPSRAALDQWHDISERLHGMTLLLSTTPDTPPRDEALEAVAALDALAWHYYDTLAAELVGQIDNHPWEVA